MAILNIVRDGDPILRKVCRPVDKVTPRICRMLDDMREVLEMMSRGLLDPSILITHICGLDAAGETTLDLPKIPGAKKLIYTGISLPLTAISDFAEKGRSDPLFAKLHELTAATNGLWNAQAEKYLLENAKSI